MSLSPQVLRFQSCLSYDQEIIDRPSPNQPLCIRLPSSHNLGCNRDPQRDIEKHYKPKTVSNAARIRISVPKELEKHIGIEPAIRRTSIPVCGRIFSPHPTHIGKRLLDSTDMASVEDNVLNLVAL